jgi:hypothetical protein
MFKRSKKSNPIPPFAQASFLNFATLPRDRKWHISKLATLPRAPYQPHAKKRFVKSIKLMHMETTIYVSQKTWLICKYITITGANY